MSLLAAPPWSGRALLKRLEWSDLDEQTRERAVRTTIRIGRMSRDNAEEWVASAVLRLMKHPPVLKNNAGRLLSITAVNMFRAAHARSTNGPRVLRFGAD